MYKKVLISLVFSIFLGCENDSKLTKDHNQSGSYTTIDEKQKLITIPRIKSRDLDEQLSYTFVKESYKKFVIPIIKSDDLQ